MGLIMVNALLFATSTLVTAAPKVTYIEKFQTREVSVHEESLNSSRTSTSTYRKGNFGLDLEFDCDFRKLTPESQISVTCGKFIFEGKLGYDHSFKSGGKSATLVNFFDSNATVKVITSQVQVKWTPTRVSLTVTGKIPDAESPVAAEIQGGNDTFMGQTQIAAKVGSANYNSILNFSGTYRRKDHARNNITGSETIIEIKDKI